MSETRQLRCANCGTESTADPSSQAACPVCGMPFRDSIRVELSEGQLTDQLSELVERARASGIAQDRIAQLLRDELTFAASMSRPGRMLHVQILDLGPQDGGRVAAPPEAGRPISRRTA